MSLGRPASRASTLAVPPAHRERRRASDDGLHRLVTVPSPPCTTIVGEPPVTGPGRAAWHRQERRSPDLRADARSPEAFTIADSAA